MDFNDEELAVLDEERQRIGVFFRMATDPVVRLWLGVGPIEPGVNAIDLTGATYNGFGELSSAPALQQLINGAAERIEFTLSGVSEEIAVLATTEANAVKLKDVAAGVGVMDETWRLLGGVHWMWRGVADFLSLDIAHAASPEAQSSRGIKLSVGSIFTGRKRRGMSYWTDQDQQARSSGDRGCERTGKYSQHITKTWPRF